MVLFLIQVNNIVGRNNQNTIICGMITVKSADHCEYLHLARPLCKTLRDKWYFQE